MSLIRGHGINDMPKNWISQSPENRRLYDLWANLLRRVYATGKMEKNKAYRDYTIDTRWFSLSNFVEDITKFPNFDHWQRAEESVHLESRVKCFAPTKCHFESKTLKHSLLVVYGEEE